MEFADHIPTPKVEGVWFYDGRQKAVCGTLCLTGHHMIFYADELCSGEIWILYKNIDAVEKRLGVDKGTIMLKCKDLKQIQITVHGVEDATNVSATAEILSSITEPTLLYPYFYRCKFQYDEDGWDLYQLKEHFAFLNRRSDRWRVTDINSDFSLCPSYSSHIIVPSSVDDLTIQKSAKFRHGGRFPALSYFHTNGTSIIQSSQPLVGSGNRRCKEDERLLNAMLGNSHRGYVLDVRSINTAAQAKTKGGGFESEHHYPRWKRIHMNLHNYFVQQESLIRIVEASNDKSGNMDRWLTKLESSNWMEYVKKALEASCLVAQCIDREEWSVLVHGAEGVDSTLTVTSLAQIILDPECRTTRGFLALLDRGWIHGGHPFADRSKHAAYSNEKQRSEGPVFPIFLECVYQLLCQFPLSFEFTSPLLLDLRMHSYASHFGTFLYNNMQERLRGKVQSKTVSLWTYLLSPCIFMKYLNPLYRRKNDVIWPSVAPQSLEFWEELFTPWSATNQVIWDRVIGFETKREELKHLASRLSKRVQIETERNGSHCALESVSNFVESNLASSEGKRESRSEGKQEDDRHFCMRVRPKLNEISPSSLSEVMPNGDANDQSLCLPLYETSNLADNGVISCSEKLAVASLLDDPLQFKSEDLTPALGNEQPCDSVPELADSDVIGDPCEHIGINSAAACNGSETASRIKEKSQVK